MNLRGVLLIFGILMLFEKTFGVSGQPHKPMGASIQIHSDGSISFGSACTTIDYETTQSIVMLHFGLPPIQREKRWQEADNYPIFYTSWLTNGIRYIQTVFITANQSDNLLQTNAIQMPNLLIVNIMGQSITNEYAEASATLKVTFGQTNAHYLELKDGVIYVQQGKESLPFACLGVPPEGVAEVKGWQLRFFGNIPPSISGSMTLKIPLFESREKIDWEALQDKDYSEELEKVKRFWASQSKRTNSVPSLRLGFNPALNTLPLKNR